MTRPAAPRWLAKDALVLLHDRSLALHGGRPGIRDEGLLDSALARPLNRRAYEPSCRLEALAATYAHAISSNHPFIDGNKRSAFLAAGVFLELNGARLIARSAEATLTMMRVAAGEMDLAALDDWIAANIADSR